MTSGHTDPVAPGRATARRPRVLVVTQEFPWPTDTGANRRLVSVIEAIAARADVDLFALSSSRAGTEQQAPAALGPARVHIERFDGAVGRLGRLGLILRPGATGTLRRRRALRVALRNWTRENYDAVWVSRVATWWLIGAPRRGAHDAPVVVDLDDLEDRKQRVRLEVERPGTAGRLAGRIKAAAWGRLQRRCRDDVAAVCVCSAEDAGELGGDPHIRVVPNGYPVPEQPAGARPPDLESPFTLSLVGFFHYRPNLDAARFLLDEVLPQLDRQARPAAGRTYQVRLVGMAPDELDRMAAAARAAAPQIDVVVTGRVERIEDELGRADAILAPIRYGGGTRIKILEAFAHRIPVVSTTLGAEGLDVTDGVELLIADSPAEYAAAIGRLAAEPRLASDLVDRAGRLFADRYTSDAVAAQVAATLEPLLRQEAR